MKRARGYLDSGWVLSSNWTSPVLKGVVQEGSTTFRSGLVIKDAIDIENLCSCRESRQWGTMCAHSISVGLHHLRREKFESMPPIPSVPQSTNKAAQGISPRPVPLPKPKANIRRLNRSTNPNEGLPLSLHVIFPPQLEPALERSKIMLCLEGQWQRGRSPLGSLPPGQLFSMSTVEARLLDALEELCEGETPSMMQITREQFVRLLSKLISHPGLTLAKKQPLEVIAEPWKPRIKATLKGDGEIAIQLGSGPLPSILSHETETWVLQQSVIRPMKLPPRCKDIANGPILIKREQVPLFLSQDLMLLEKEAELEANFRLEDFSLAPKPPRFLLHLRGGIAQLEALLQCAYGKRIMTVGVTNREESSWLPDPECPTRYSTRDLKAEQTAISRLVRQGFHGPDEEGCFRMNGQNTIFNFFAREYPRLQKEWQVTLEQRLEQSTQKHFERIEPQFAVTPSGVQWFNVEISYQTGSGQKFSAAEIQRLIRSGQGYSRLPNGKVALFEADALEELQETLLDCNPQQIDSRYRIHQNQAGFLNTTIQEYQEWKFNAPPAWAQKTLTNAEDSALPPLGQLDSVLRPYQKKGTAWLYFLRQHGFCGILADEMGLGKTVQVLALLLALKRQRISRMSSNNNMPESAEAGRPSLVVCPTSLVYNWVAEAAKFTPELGVLEMHGSERHQHFPSIDQYDVVVTSYALIRRDAEHYQNLEFDTLILDEAQHIKNRQTQNAQAVKSIRAAYKIVLTGTPIENSVLDIWSIFDFLMPGYLGIAKDFRERYEVPIVREKSEEAQARLARRLRPFILRRLKRDVAQDLPPKIDQVMYCELTSEQAEVYQQVLESSRQEVLNAVDAQGLAKSRMVILTALLRLRQVCCDLRLLNLENVNPDNASAKLDLFAELLEETMDGGHRTLVFSQFTSMLALIQERLKHDNISFCYLDGSTRDRAEVVNRFQEDSSIPVFLISLKAGGLGLNLTAADTVIHYDPWWNPAVEDQATDRAHRIGQKQVVTSYKLITRGTVEEKILQLQNRKREMIQGALGAEGELSDILSWEELQDLFR